MLIFSFVRYVLKSAGIKSLVIVPKIHPRDYSTLTIVAVELRRAHTSFV